MGADSSTVTDSLSAEDPISSDRQHQAAKGICLIEAGCDTPRLLGQTLGLLDQALLTGTGRATTGVEQ